MSRTYRWNLEQYNRLTEIDIFDGARVELLDGEIWTLGRQSPQHATAVQKTRKYLRVIFGNGFVISPKMPVTLTETSEPEPDVSVVLGKIDDYADHHPQPSEILLLVEVADESLAKDREVKRKIYAKASIIDYWIANLIHHQLEVYRQPTPEGIYLDSRIYQPSESVEPLSAPGKSVAVSDLLPPFEQGA